MADYILQENGDKLLQETGDGLLLEVQPSASPSVSPSTSVSPSISSSVSPSQSISPSLSPSLSPSPSPGWTGYTREDAASLPTDVANLTTTYSEQDYIDVATDDTDRVAQTVTSFQYGIHQFKVYNESASDTDITWIGQSTLAPTLSTIYLQIYDADGTVWETIDSDGVSASDTDFTLSANIADLTNYRSSDNTIACRVYQLDV